MVTVSVEVAVPPLDNETVVGFSDAVSPDGETVPDRVTVAAKPLTLAMVSVAVPEDPA